MNGKKNTESDSFNGLITVGFLTGKVSPGRPMGMRRFQHDFMAFLARGEAVFEWERGDSLKVVGPCLIHAPKEIPHRYDPDVSTPWRNYWMFFDADECRRRFGDVTPPPGASPLAGDFGVLERVWRELYDAAAVAGRKTGVMANYLIHAVLMEMWRATVAGEEEGGDVMVSKARRMMAARVHDPSLDCRWLAGELGMGYDNFRILFKKRVGLAPKQCYLEMKINAAKAMLATPGCRVSEAADALGFKDPFYFSRIFKRKTGLAPNEFARKNGWRE